jgi:hypothetical protein
MPEKSKKVDTKKDFQDLFGTMSDEQLLEVLNKRNLYQPEAKGAAIHEAINRGLIASEDDLNPDYMEERQMKLRLFPEIELQNARDKTRKSLARGLFLAGLLPGIRGIVMLNAGHQFEAILLLLFGLLWMGCAAWLIRNYNQQAVVGLFVLMLLSVGYIIRMIIVATGFIFMDWFIMGVLYLLTLYGLLFIAKLHR